MSYRVGLHVPHEAVPSLAEVSDDGFSVPEGATRVFDGGRWQEAWRMARSAIGTIPRPGPLALEDVTATIYVPAGWGANADGAGNLLLRRIL